MFWQVSTRKGIAVATSSSRCHSNSERTSSRGCCSSAPTSSGTSSAPSEHPCPVAENPRRQMPTHALLLFQKDQERNSTILLHGASSKRVNNPARWPRTRGGRCRHTTRDATGAIPLGNRMSKTQHSKCTVIFKSNFKFCGPVCATGSVLGSPPDPAPSSAPASSPDPAPALAPRLPTPRLRLRPTDSSPGPRPTGGLF